MTVFTIVFGWPSVADAAVCNAMLVHNDLVDVDLGPLMADLRAGRYRLELSGSRVWTDPQTTVGRPLTVSCRVHLGRERARGRCHMDPPVVDEHPWESVVDVGERSVGWMLFPRHTLMADPRVELRRGRRTASWSLEPEYQWSQPNGRGEDCGWVGDATIVLELASSQSTRPLRVRTGH